MGGSSWNDSYYDSAKSTRAAAGKPTFGYTHAVLSGTAPNKTHESLDPKNMKNGVRECLDSTEHPNSTPIYIGLDVTGSMKQVPHTIQTNLKTLMKYLLTKGLVVDPAICISAIGDAERGDNAPFQVGQFESGIEIDNDLTNIYIEGGGGGNNQESYDLALYFLSKCVKIDAWEKRKKKGYAFIICDEAIPQVCQASSVMKVFGHTVEGMNTVDLVKEVSEKWEVFCIVPNLTSHYQTRLQDSWKSVLGERVIFLDDPSLIVECIAGCIGSLEGSDVEEDFKSEGLDNKKIESLSRALAKVPKNQLTKLAGTGLKVL